MATNAYQNPLSYQSIPNGDFPLRDFQRQSERNVCALRSQMAQTYAYSQMGQIYMCGGRYICALHILQPDGPDIAQPDRTNICSSLAKMVNNRCLCQVLSPFDKSQRVKKFIVHSQFFCIM